MAVARAKDVRRNSEEWTRYMDEKGGIVLLPKNVTDVGKKEQA
jgi:hypothetical protein